MERFDVRHPLANIFSPMIELCVSPVDIIEVSVRGAALFDKNLSIHLYNVRLYLLEADWAHTQRFPKDLQFIQRSAPTIKAMGSRIIDLVANLSCFFTFGMLGFLKRDAAEYKRRPSQMAIGTR